MCSILNDEGNVKGLMGYVTHTQEEVTVLS